MSIAIGSSRESNPSRTICHLRAVPLGHVAKPIFSEDLRNAIVKIFTVLVSTTTTLRKYRSSRLYLFLCILSHIYPPITRKRSTRYTSSLSCQPSVCHTKMGESRLAPFPTALQVNLPACSSHCPFNAERQAGKL